MAKIIYTNDQVIAQLDSGYHWNSLDLTYAFPTTATWFPYAEKTGFSAMSAAQQAAATLALSLWDDLIKNDFRQVSGDTANIKYENTTTNVGYAHAYYPGSWAGAGSVWLNNSYGAGSGTNNLVTPVVGDWGFQTYIHETGHALGLDHPGAYNGGSPTYATDALYAQDSQQYTIMSYFTANNTGADWFASDGRWYYPQTPMLHDVMAIQAIYGAETTTRTGNTTYGFNATSDVPSIFNFAVNKHPVLCIYDSAGIDTLDFSGWNTASRIDLAPGSFSDSDMMTSNISIAFTAMIENARGGGGSDVIAGNAVANLLSGLGGNDQLAGLAGDDTLDGGDGNDTLTGGTGNDRLIGGIGTDTAVFSGVRANYTITFDSAASAYIVTDSRGASFDGIDWLFGVEFFKFLDALVDWTTIQPVAPTPVPPPVPTPVPTATEGADTLSGTANADTMSGLGGNDRLNGLAGNDRIDGGLGADSLYGGQGDDLYIVDNVGDRVFENAGEGIDRVQSSVSFTLGLNVEHLTLTGSLAIDGMGNDLANEIIGNAANNVLDGGLGADTMTGGAGNDVYVVDNAGDRVFENAGEGIDRVQASVTYALGANVENLTLTGTLAINGTGNALANVMIGNAAANVLDGGLGADTMTGGAGNDIYYVDSAGDQVVEAVGGGLDTVYASISTTLAANVENLVLTGTGGTTGVGNELANRITGNAASNSLDGGLGDDILVGGAGNDTYFLNSTADQVIELVSEGVDTVYSTATWTMSANVENLVLYGTAAINGTGNTAANVMNGNAASNALDGGAGADTLYGNAGNDKLLGGDNNDMLFGGDGADSLWGGAGSDYLSGGAGNDLFVFNAVSDSVGLSRDVIIDFVRGQDRIDLSAIDARTTVVGNDVFGFIGAGAFSGVAGQLRAVNGLVQGDVNGDKIADFEVVVSSVTTFAASDFIL